MTAFIVFCVKLSKSTAETLDMLHEAYGELSLSWTVVFEWNSCLEVGQVSVEDECSGQPSTCNMTENVEEI